MPLEGLRATDVFSSCPWETLAPLSGRSVAVEVPCSCSQLSETFPAHFETQEGPAYLPELLLSRSLRFNPSGLKHSVPAPHKATPFLSAAQMAS